MACFAPVVCIYASSECELDAVWLYVLPRQVFVTLFGLDSWAPVTVPVLAALANVTVLAEVWRRLSFNH